MFQFKRKFNLSELKINGENKSPIKRPRFCLNTFAGGRQSSLLNDISTSSSASSASNGSKTVTPELSDISTKPITPSNDNAIHNDSETTVLVVDTPPHSPELEEPPKPSKINDLKAELASAITESDEAQAQLDGLTSKFQELCEERAAINMQKSRLEDAFEEFATATRLVRDLCNDIYHSGLKLANDVGGTYEDLKKQHTKHLEKTLMELNNHIETSSAAIGKKITEYDHEIELHKRTLMHIQSLENEAKTPEQKVQQVEEKSDGEKQIKSHVAVEEDEVPVEPEDEDDCQITEVVDKQSESEMVAGRVDVVTSEVSSNVGYAQINNENIDNEETQSVDTETTDIDDAGSFTPCQAQRPN